MKKTKSLKLSILMLALTSCVIISCGESQFIPEKYTEEVPSGGTIEATYLKNGPYVVSSWQCPVNEDFKSITVYYPSEMGKSNRKYPVVVFVNGTGVVASKYAPLFEHLASWGFIVVGNEEPESWDGDATEKSLALLLEKDNDGGSIFYKKIDRENIGVSGHSQGGAGVFNAITAHPHSGLYKAAVSLSPTHEEQAIKLKWHYDLRKIKAPILLVAGTSGFFETKFVIPFERMTAMYNKIPSPKVMMRRSGCEHGQMLYSADGYVTAWFMWQLQGDNRAAQAFTGNSPEIKENKHYQDQRIDL